MDLETYLPEPLVWALHLVPATRVLEAGLRSGRYNARTVFEAALDAIYGAERLRIPLRVRVALSPIFATFGSIGGGYFEASCGRGAFVNGVGGIEVGDAEAPGRYLSGLRVHCGNGKPFTAHRQGLWLLPRLSISCLSKWPLTTTQRVAGRIHRWET